MSDQDDARKPIIAEHIANWYPEGSTGWMDARRPGPKGVTLVVSHVSTRYPFTRWTIGTNVDEAKRSWQSLNRNEAARLSDGYTVYTFDADTEFHGVDDKGRYLFVGNSPEVRVVKPRRTASI